jgi:hypothetical protein
MDESWTINIQLDKSKMRISLMKRPKVRINVMLKDSIIALGGAQTCQDVAQIVDRVGTSKVDDMLEALNLIGMHYPDVPLPTTLATNLEQLGLAVLVHRYPSQEGLYQQLCASARPLQSILEAAASNQGLSSVDCKAALARFVKDQLVIEQDEEEEEEEEEQLESSRSKKRSSEEVEDEDTTTKRAKDEFDAANLLAEIKPMIHLPLAHYCHFYMKPPNAGEATTLLAAFVHNHLPGRGLSSLVRSFRDPLAEGAYIKLALALDCDWSEIGATLGITAKDPATTARVQLAQFLYDLIVTHGLHQLRYLQPTDRHVMPRFKGHIRPIKTHIESGMSADEKKWWRGGNEQAIPPMLSTTASSGKVVSYVDPTWLLQ